MSGARTFASTTLIGALTTTVSTTIAASIVVLAPIVALEPAVVAASSAPSVAGAPSRYAPVGPLRLADTRAPDCGCVPVEAGTIRVQIAGRDGIPTGITAAAVTVTATRTAGTGFVTVFPAGTARPETSILNLVAGSDTANSGIVPVGADGALDVYANVQTDLIVDITGTFTEAATADTGRFVPVTPSRPDSAARIPRS
jgi:hypothetical protein